MIFVKPREGYIVRDPINMQPVPKEGRFVEETQYWRQRIMEGDLTEETPPVEQEPPPVEPASPENQPAEQE
jgi:uncharacterized protein DUF2635